MTGPQAIAAVPQAPHGRTARRVDWMLLPPMLRRAIEQRIGFAVVEARSAGAGFTPGFASVLVGGAGQRVFVKAANAQAQAPFADAYREEVRKLAALPPGLPVPRLLWSMDAEWVVVAMEYVDGENPSRPWQPAQVEACLDTLEALADTLTPAPAAMRLEPMTAPDEFGAMLTGWAYAARQLPDWPHLEEAAALAARHEEALCGTTLVHTDARDDNFRITPQGRAVLCDWNWPVLGPAWADSVMLLISVSGEGHDVEEILARRRLTREVAPEHVDVLLALLCGYFLEARDRPVPNSSPFLRIHQSWYAEASWSWLAARRGWRC